MQMSRNIMTSVISFLLMLLFWGFLFQSIWFALAFLVVLFIHEMGHYVVAKKLGIDVSEPVFTPIGALIQLREMPKNAWDEALMAYGGPFIGTLGAIAALLLGTTFQVPELILAGQVGFMLNLFNLIPLSPLDGGRISMAISRHLWVIGAVLFLGWILMNGVSLLALVMVFLIANWAISDIQGRRMQAINDPAYFQVSASKRAAIVVAYLGLGTFLFLALSNFGALVNWLLG